MSGTGDGDTTYNNDLNERGFWGNLWDSVPSAEEIKDFWTLPGDK